MLGNPVRLTGTGSDQTVLSIAYDPAGLTETAEADLFLAWLNPQTGLWVNAVQGNTGGAAVTFTESYDAYLASLGQDATPALGAYGVDLVGNSVWAVIDHNSLFGAATPAALTAVPEPLAALGGAGLIGLLTQRRRVRPDRPLAGG